MEGARNSAGERERERAGERESGRAGPVQIRRTVGLNSKHAIFVLAVVMPPIFRAKLITAKVLFKVKEQNLCSLRSPGHLRLKQATPTL